MVPKDNERFTVYCADGADYIADTKEPVDIIVVDGFDVGGQAPTLCTEEFYKNCYQALADNGVMAVNLSENSKQHSTFIGRMRRVFSDAVFVVGAEDCTNKVVFAVKRDNENSHSEQSLLAQAAMLDKRHPVSFRQIIERMVSNRHNKLSSH
jgi:spermidine synthase